MQEESPIPFEPVYICYGPPPWYIRLYLLYLMAITLLAAIRLLRIGWLLRPFPRRHRSSLQGSSGNSGVSASAPAEKGIIGSGDATSVSSPPPNLSSVHSVEAEFARLWETSQRRLHTLRSVMILTLLLASLVSCVGIINILRSIAIQRSTSLAVFSLEVSETLIPLAASLFVIAVLYAFYAILQAVLARRRTERNAFCANGTGGVKGK